jgi:hypothetical protein
MESIFRAYSKETIRQKRESICLTVSPGGHEKRRRSKRRRLAHQDTVARLTVALVEALHGWGIAANR